LHLKIQVEPKLNQIQKIALKPLFWQRKVFKKSAVRYSIFIDGTLHSPQCLLYDFLGEHKQSACFQFFFKEYGLR